MLRIRKSYIFRITASVAGKLVPIGGGSFSDGKKDGKNLMIGIEKNAAAAGAGIEVLDKN